MITPDSSPTEAAIALLQELDRIDQAGDTTVLEGNVSRLLGGTELVCRPLSVYPKFELQSADWGALPEARRANILASYRDLGELAHRMCVFADLPTAGYAPWLESDELVQLDQDASEGFRAASCLSVRYDEFGAAVSPQHVLQLAKASLKAYLAWGEDMDLSDYARSKLKLGFTAIAMACPPKSDIVDADRAPRNFLEG